MKQFRIYVFSGSFMNHKRRFLGNGNSENNYKQYSLSKVDFRDYDRMLYNIAYISSNYQAEKLSILDPFRHTFDSVANLVQCFEIRIINRTC